MFAEYPQPLVAKHGTHSARLVIVGDNQPTPSQLAETQKEYSRFRLMVTASLANYFVHHRTLLDGSTLRITSNNGQDFVYLAPTSGGAGESKSLTLAGYVILPAIYTHQGGWNKATFPDSARAYLPDGKTTAKLHTKLNAGAVDWRNAKGNVVLTWNHGGNNRYATGLWDTVFDLFLGNGDNASSNIYYKGTTIATTFGVSAAAIYKGWLVAISNGVLYACSSPLNSIDSALKANRFIAQVTPAWSVITVTGTVPTRRRCSAYHFSPDGSIAACATVPTSAFDDGGAGSWTLGRMRTEALPQRKEYVTLSTDGTGTLTAAVSQVAYTTEAFSVTIGGATMGVTIALPGSGDITFAGKRLWGIDFAPDGTELIISCKRDGSGVLDYVGGVHSVLQFSNKWGVYINDVWLCGAHYNLPQITGIASSDPGAVSYTQSGGGLLSTEYIALHALDARSKAAIVERLTLAYTTAVGRVNSASSNPYGFADSAYTVSSAREVYFDGALITSTPEIAVTTAVPPLFACIDTFQAAYMLAYGLWYDSDSYPYIPAFPQQGSFYGENHYEWIYHLGGDSRMRNQFFQSYPNQVTDALQKTMALYTEVVDQWIFNWQWSSAPVCVFIGTFTGTMSTATGQDYLINLGAPSAIVPGLAIRATEPKSFVVAGRDSFVNQFFDTVNRVKNANAGTSTNGVPPACTAVLATKTDTGWTMTDLLAPIGTQVAADPDTTSFDSTTFRIDPVRVL